MMYRQQINDVLTRKRSADDAVDRETGLVESAKQHAADAIAAQQILQTVAAAVQSEAHERVASIVTRCLAAVFDEPYTFEIRFEQKRGRTEARLVFVRDSMEVDPISAAGGGVVDLASFALRLSCLMLALPPLRPLLVLDEPFRFVSAEYRPRVRALIETLAGELGVQFLIVTHIDELRCGKVVEL